MDTPRYQVLVDNNPAGENFACEHGYSVFIEHKGVKILLDTGRSTMFADNAALCGIDPLSADIVVLSHGHYDHTDGLPALENLPVQTPIYLHSDFFAGHYSLRDDDTVYDVSPSQPSKEFLESRRSQLRFIDSPVEIAPDIWLTGTISRNTDFEDVGGRFFVDADRTAPDPINDDISLWIDAPDGLWIFTGCCHSGIVNTLEAIFAVAGHRNVALITGGLHLLNASEDRLSKTGEYLRSLGDFRLNLLHCTGEAAVAYLQDVTGHASR